MNTITLYVDEFKGPNNLLIKSGISFCDVQIVKLLIDGEDILMSEGFEDTLLYFNELATSYRESGKYLLFTSSSGVTLEGVWERVEVVLGSYTIKWAFELGDKIYEYEFKKDEYISEVKSIEEYLRNNNELDLEPVSVVYPEDCL